MAGFSARRVASGYFYADITGSVRSFRFNPATKVVSEKTDRTADLFPNGAPAFPCSFGEDADGELYLLNLTPGEVYQFVPQP